MDTYTPLFNLRAFLSAEFGNAEAVVSAVEDAGMQPPTRVQVYGWAARESMPGTWLAILLRARETQTGRPVSLAPYFRPVAGGVFG